jgi:hypothetical protein
MVNTVLELVFPLLLSSQPLTCWLGCWQRAQSKPSTTPAKPSTTPAKPLQAPAPASAAGPGSGTASLPLVDTDSGVLHTVGLELAFAACAAVAVAVLFRREPLESLLALVARFGGLYAAVRLVLAATVLSVRRLSAVAFVKGKCGHCEPHPGGMA